MVCSQMMDGDTQVVSRRMSLQQFECTISDCPTYRRANKKTKISQFDSLRINLEEEGRERQLYLHVHKLSQT